MKRRICFLLLVLCLSLMVSCAKDTASQPITINGVEVIFREDGESFSYGENVYRYRVSGNRVDVTYPNGIIVFRTYMTNGYAGGIIGEGDYSDLDGYLDQDTVFDLLGGGSRSNNDRSGNGSYVLIGLLCTTIGAFNCFATETSWYLSHGWHYRNAEPSELSLGWIKVSGGILMVVGAVLLLAGLF